MKSRGGIWYLKGLSSCFIRRGWALRFNECRLKVGLCWSAATGDTCASLSAAANQSGLEGMKGDWAVAALILCVCVRCQQQNTHHQSVLNDLLGFDFSPSATLQTDNAIFPTWCFPVGSVLTLPASEFPFTATASKDTDWFSHIPAGWPKMNQIEDL